MFQTLLYSGEGAGVMLGTKKWTLMKSSICFLGVAWLVVSFDGVTVAEFSGCFK